MISRDYSLLLYEQIVEDGIVDLQVHHIDDIGTVQSDFITSDIHDEAEPFAVFLVPENAAPVILLPRIFGLNKILVAYVFENFVFQILSHSLSLLMTE